MREEATGAQEKKKGYFISDDFPQSTERFEGNLHFGKSNTILHV